MSWCKDIDGLCFISFDKIKKKKNKLIGLFRNEMIENLNVVYYKFENLRFLWNLIFENFLY